MTQTGDAGVGRQIADAIDDLYTEGLEGMPRTRPYNGQPWTTHGVRGKTVVSGLTMRDILDCYIRGYCLSVGGGDVPSDDRLCREADRGEAANLNANDLYTITAAVDPMAVYQNMMGEIERLMGIFPNIREMSYEETMEYVPVIDMPEAQHDPTEA